jgi:hypothetical protein
MTGHVFVSYVREDSLRVDNLRDLLAAAELPVWLDIASLWPGDSWRAKIRAAIRDDALVFLACFSQHSVSRTSSYQNDELILAIEEMRLRPPGQSWLIPVRFDDCKLPEREIGGGLVLTDLHRADLFGESCEQNGARLVAAIHRIIGRPTGSAGPAETSSETQPDRPADLASSDTAAGGQRAKYAINLSGARGVQIGDGNIQHNTFSREFPGSP